MKPGEGLQKTLELTKVFDLTKPGRYFVRVTHVVVSDSDDPSDKTIETAVSNPVIFEVLP